MRSCPSSMSSYPPPSSKKHGFLVSPGAGLSFGQNMHTTIDPFGSLRSQHSIENWSDKTPKTPIDPLYLHPRHSEPDPLPGTLYLDKRSSPCAALPKNHLGSQNGSRELQSARNSYSTSVGKAGHDPLMTPVNDEADHGVKLGCQSPEFTEPSVALNSIATHRCHDMSVVTPVPANTSPIAATGSNVDWNGNHGLDDHSADSNMVICEPGGLVSLLSRSFQFVFSKFEFSMVRSPPFQIEFQVDKCDQRGGQDDGSNQDNFEVSDDDDSQDSAINSQPSSPQTPLCYSSATPWPVLVTPTSSQLQSNSPSFSSPARTMHCQSGSLGLPPNWLPWRPSYGSIQDRRRRRRQPPPLLPTLSPSSPDDDECRGKYFPTLPRRSLPPPRCGWATLHTERVLPLERPCVSKVSCDHNYRLIGLQSAAVPVQQSIITLGPTICCPLSGGIMLEPVIDPDGFSYEKAAILQWLETHTTSPITDRPLAPHQLRPNRTLRCVIQSLLQSTASN